MPYVSLRAATVFLLVGPVLAIGCGVATSASRPNPMAPVSSPALRVLSPYTYEWFLRAEILVARGKLKEACTAYEQALASSEEDPYVLARWARALDLVGDEPRAAEVLQHATELGPRAEIVWLTRGQLALRHQRFDEAVQSFERAEQVAPGSLEGTFALADTLTAMGAPERAHAVLERAAARAQGPLLDTLRTQLQLALSRGDAGSSYTQSQQLLTWGAVDDRSLEHAASLQLAAHSPWRALALLQHVPLAPGNVRLRLDALLALDRCNEALTLLDNHEPALLGGEAAVAEAYLRCDAATRALPIAELLVARDANAANLALRGRVALAMGDAQAAAQDLSAALANNPSDAAARIALSNALVAGGMRELAAELAEVLPEVLAEQRAQ
jgi:predicted Zn-dependent protease